MSICVGAGVAATVTSAALISAVVTRPQQVATAIGNQDLQALLGIISDGVLAAVRELVRYL